MSTRFVMHTADDLVEALEQRAQKSREAIGTTRTKLESNELKGEVYAFNEAIFYVKEYIKTIKEDARDARPTATMEDVDYDPSPALRAASGGGIPVPIGKVKPGE